MRKQKMSEIIQPNEEIRIQDGSKVDLHFSVSIENGVEIDNTRNREEPVSLVIGDGNLLPGFEKALFGLRAGI
jgi:FKBP-type peptidyl-prolyl cis-trans isomerase SlpA